MTDDVVTPPQTDAVPDGAPQQPRRSRKKRWLVSAATSVVVLGVGGYGFFTALNHFGATVQRYLRAVGSGDYAQACGILTDSGKAKLMAEQQSATCEAAAEHWRASLSPSQLGWLQHGDIWVNGYAAEDSRKEIQLIGNPIGIKSWALYKHDGHEWISEWGPDAQKIPPATS